VWGVVTVPEIQSVCNYWAICLDQYTKIKESSEITDYDNKIKEIQDKLNVLYNKYKTTDNRYRALFNLGLIQYESKKYAAAQNNFKEIYKNKLNYFLSPIALIYSACCYEELGRNQDAIDEYEFFDEKR